MATKEQSPNGASPAKGRPPAASRAKEPAAGGGLLVASGPRALRQGTPETEESED